MYQIHFACFERKWHLACKNFMFQQVDFVLFLIEHTRIKMHRYFWLCKWLRQFFIHISHFFSQWKRQILPWTICCKCASTVLQGFLSLKLGKPTRLNLNLKKTSFSVFLAWLFWPVAWNRILFENMTCDYIFHNKYWSCSMRQIDEIYGVGI